MSSLRFLVVAESFYSIQGEGAQAGKPAVFLRLSGCNLRCNGFSYQDPHTGEYLGCDSKQVWRGGQRKFFAEILADWQTAGWLEKLKQGAHLVITGGEPLLQQTALARFIHELDTSLQSPVFIEIETNATILMQEQLFQRINQFNISPKLQHSGESRMKAYLLPVLQHYASSKKSVFKFVIANPEDIHEVLKEYVVALGLAHQSIWLMPEGGTLADIQARRPWLVELCKQYCFNFTTRLQVDIWGEVVGV